MKLAIVYHQFLRAGGLENYLIEWCSQMQAVGHELHIITARVTSDVAEKLHDVVWHSIRRPPGPLLRLAQFNLTAQRIAKALPVDLVLGFGRTTMQDAHRAGGGCHQLYSALLPWYKRWSAKNLLELALERRLYNGGGTRQFVTNSQRVSAQLQGLYPGARDKCRVIYTAVDTEYFKPAENRNSLRQQICREMQTDANQPIGLFVSLSHRRKGLDALLQAWQKVKGSLWIAGRPLDQRYLGMIEALGLKDRVRALPPTKDLRALYQTADWFVHPTLYDACANTVLQSMASGLPGIISAQDGAIDHIHDKQNGLALYHPTQVNELQERLNEAFGMGESQRQQLALAARETMLPLTWSAHIKDWHQLIAELA